MKNFWHCKHCGSKNVFLEALINPNDHEKKVFLSFYPQIEPYTLGLCNSCLRRDFLDVTFDYEIGDKVYYTDPEGASSGFFRIIKVPEYINSDGIYLISDGFSEIEAYGHELTYPDKKN